MGQPSPTEHRVNYRKRVLKGGAILTGVTNSEIKCSIHNMHDSGAELKVDVEARIPHEFLLYVPVDGIAYRAVTRWRQDNKVGVMFVGKEPKPHWHYG